MNPDSPPISHLAWIELLAIFISSNDQFINGASMRNWLIAGLTLGLSFIVNGAVHGQWVYGLTMSNNLIRYWETDPSSSVTIGSISGTLPGHTLHGIDFRPADANLYAISTNSLGTVGQLYSVNLTTAELSVIGTGFTLNNNTAANQLSMKFIPTQDQLRLVTSGGQNYRINPTTGLMIQEDSSLNPGSPFIAGLGHSNNFVETTTTTLYAVEVRNGTIHLVTIGGLDGNPSPDAGQVFSIGSTGLVPSSNRISFGLEQDDNPFFLDQAFLVADIPGFSGDSLYIMDLSNGTVSRIGTFADQMSAFSHALAAVPEPAPFVLVIVGGSLFALVYRWKQRRHEKALEQ